MKTVWIVEGDTGEYGDHINWVAAVCTNKRTAESLAARFNAIVKGVRGHDRERRAETIRKLIEAGCIDPAIDYTGTSFNTTNYPLYETVRDARKKRPF